MTRRPSSRLLLAIAAAVLLCAILVYRSLYTHEQLLFQQLSAFAKTVDGPNPRPDLVTRLSPEDVPILLKWLETPDRSPTIGKTFVRRVNSLADSLGFRGGILFMDAHPRFLALVGFHYLGSNAVAALPRLQELASERSLIDENALVAIVYIGAPSFDIALEFCQSPKPALREKGAYLLRCLQMNRQITVPLLLKMLDDVNPNVRGEAYTALADFPGPDVEAVVIPKLLNLDREDWRDAAYTLHTGSTNALMQLVDLCVSTTNTEVQAAALSALSRRDGRKRPSHDPQDTRFYTAERKAYDMVYFELAERTAVTNLNFEKVALIKSNILNGQSAYAAGTLLPPDESRWR